jgi:hypothetical protein
MVNFIGIRPKQHLFFQIPYHKIMVKLWRL